jgi:hypothetical protein
MTFREGPVLQVLGVVASLPVVTPVATLIWLRCVLFPNRAPHPWLTERVENLQRQRARDDVPNLQRDWAEANAVAQRPRPPSHTPHASADQAQPSGLWMVRGVPLRPAG